MDDENIIPRIGTFFLVIGFILIIMFVASDLAETVYYDLFFIGVLFGAFGLFLRRKLAPPPPSGRFETWRSIRAGKYKDEQAKKHAKQQEESIAKRQARKEAKQAKRSAKKGGDE